MRTPDWQTADGAVRLFLGDSLELLGDVSADAVITDPVWPNAPVGMFPGVVPFDLWHSTCRVLPEVRQLVVVMRNDCDPRFLSCVPERLRFQQVVWLQYVMPGYLGRVLGGNECGYVFGKPVASQPGRRVIPSVSPKAQPSDRPPNGHPCSRAQIHFDWLLGWFSDEGETVCDPFLGSGTTGVASVRTRRRFIGIEKEPKYFDIAVKRIEAEMKRTALFEPPPVILKQRELI